MGNLLKVSEAASLAIHAASLMAESGGAPLRTAQMAEKLSASEAHLSKVLQRLARAGLVRGNRGPGGGFILAREPSGITFMEIYEAIDGRISPSACLFGEPVCGGKTCALGATLHAAQKKLVEYLESTTLKGTTGCVKPVFPKG
jgi:Rrf2 family protein